MTTILTAVLLLAMLAGLALVWAGRKAAGWALWTATQAGFLALDLATGRGPGAAAVDAAALLLGALVLADLRRKARA